MSHDDVFSFTITGASGVGKSCLVLQYCDKCFQPVYEETIRNDFGARVVTIDNKRVKLQLWDLVSAQI
jgi:Ras-related protein Rab-2A